MTWRTGRKVGRTIYDDNDQLIGMMDTPELAKQTVDAINTVARIGLCATAIQITTAKGDSTLFATRCGLLAGHNGPHGLLANGATVYATEGQTPGVDPTPSTKTVIPHH